MAYKPDLLMEEARQLAAAFYSQQGETLALTNEIAQYDAARYFQLSEQVSKYIYMHQKKKVLIKGRVIFDEQKIRHYRVGQLHLTQKWDALWVVLLNAAYESTKIYGLSRSHVEALVSSATRTARLSLGQVQAQGVLLWESNAGMTGASV